MDAYAEAEPTGSPTSSPSSTASPTSSPSSSPSSTATPIYSPPSSSQPADTQPAITLPQVASQAASGITSNTATLNGSILNDGGGDITDSGFEWGTSPGNLQTVHTGGLTYSLAGLTEDTTYYFQAFAVNKAGTQYGGLLSFKTTAPPLLVSTFEATDINFDTATLHGTVTGGGKIISSGFSISPSTAGDISAAPGADGAMSVVLHELKPGIAYSFTAFAVNADGKVAGSSLSFTTLKVLPKVQTLPPDKISMTGAALHGSILDKGSSDITESGFLWGTGSKPGNKITTGSGVEKFSYLLKNLKPDTTYYIQAYANNSEGVGYGSVVSFKTFGGDPEVETRPAEKITPVGATLNGYILKNKGLEITDSGFLWGKDPKPDKRVKILPGTDKQTMTNILKGLEPNTTYYFQAYASNVAGTGYGDILKFTTATNAPVVETRPCGETTSVAGELNGFILDDRGFDITDSGFLWGTDPDPVNKVSITPGDDKKTLSYSLVRLRGGTTYYIQAYAVNSEGIGYGKIVSFTTNPSVLPAVETTSAQFDAVNWQPVLTGGISSNGGDPVATYGFRYSTDQSNWTSYTVGQDDYSGEYTARITGDEKLPPGTYYVQAYALNSVGTGYGTTVKFTTPALPAVTCRAASPATGSTTAVLTGNITDTGGEDVSCDTRQFQYRKAGGKDWQNAGVSRGTFGTGEFTFNLDGLEPGDRYEFRAQAQSAAGWGGSQTVTLTAGWGQDDREAAKNMKAAGLSIAKVADIMKNTYDDSAEAAFNALLYAGFVVNDIASVLKGGYSVNYQTCIGFLKGSGFDVITVAGVMEKVYPQEMWTMASGNTDLGMIRCLKESDYSADDVITAMRTLFKYQLSDCAKNLSSGKGFTLGETYGAIIRVYGGNALAAYLWNSWTKSRGYMAGSNAAQQQLESIAGILRKNGGLSIADTFEAIKGTYPSIDMNMTAGVLYRAGYSITETGTTLVRAFGNDPLAVSRAFVTKTVYEDSKIEEFLIKGMNTGAPDMVKILYQVLNNRFRPEKEIPRVLDVYYGMDAGTAAVTMYSAGYNLDGLIRSMKDYYHLSTADNIIGIFGKIGLPAVLVIDKVRNNYDTSIWLTAYRLHGYSAVDYIAWVKSDPTVIFGSRSSQYFGSETGIKDQTSWLFRSLIKAGYSLYDSALAIKKIYGISENTAFKIYSDVNKGEKFNLNSSDIVAAIDQAYGTDSLQSIVKGMINTGSSAVQAATSMKSSFGVSDPEKAAGYLAQAGCSESVVLDALEIAFYNRSTGKDTLDKLYLIDRNVFKQNNVRAVVDTLLRAAGSGTVAENITRLLNGNGYSVKDISLVLKDCYSLSSYQVVDALLKVLGANRQKDIMAGVSDAFGSDIIPDYVKNLKNKGLTAGQSLDTLNSLFGITDAQKSAFYLALAGYIENDVISELIKTAYHGQATPETLKALADIMQQAYDKIQADIAGMLKASGVNTPSTAVEVLNKGGYAPDTIIRVLRNEYRLPSAQTLDVLLKSGLYQQKAVTSQIQAVYGGDSLRIYADYLQSLGYDEKNINSSGAIQVLDQGGFTLTEIIRALKDIYKLPSVQAIDALSKSGLYQQKDITTQIQAVYGGDFVQIYLQYLQSQGYDAKTIGSSNAIKMLNQGGYALADIIKALKGVYDLSPELAMDALVKSGLYQHKDILSQIQAAYGEDYNLVCLQYLRSKGYDTRNIDAVGAVKTLNQGGFTTGDIVRMLKDTCGLSSEQAVDALLKSGLYQQKDAALQVQAVYGGSFTQVYLQYLQSKGYDAASLDSAGVIPVMRLGGYNLLDIIRALKDLYNLPVDKAVDVLLASGFYDRSEVETQAKAAYGGDFILLYLNYWKKLGWGTDAAFREMSEKLGITDAVKKFAYLKKAGYSEDDAWSAITWNARNEMVPVMKNIYGLNDPAAIGKQFKQTAILNKYYTMYDLAGGFKRAFPDITTARIVSGLAAAGFPKDTSGIGGWLRTYAEDGKKDDELAAILGSAHPDDVGLRSIDVVEILYYKGYTLEETTSWLLKDKFAWEGFFANLVSYYAPKNYPQSYFENNSASKYIVMALKKIYSIEDLTRGELGYLEQMSGASGPTEQMYASIYADLISAGYSMDESITIIAKQGATGVSSLISIMMDNSISRANAARNPSLRLTASVIAEKLYNLGSNTPGISMSLTDIARGFVIAGPNAGAFAAFKKVDIYDAMKLITGKYLQKTGSDAPVDITALYILRSGGLSVSDAAAMLADARVGLSTGSVIKSVFGIGNDWVEALTDLVGAGYSTTDSISAIYCNKDYHNIIGVSILSAITTKAITFLDDSGTAATVIKVIKKVGKQGFKLGNSM